MKNFCIILSLFFLFTTAAPVKAEDALPEHITSIGDKKITYYYWEPNKIETIGNNRVIYLNDTLREAFHSNLRGVAGNYVDPTIIDKIGDKTVTYKKFNGSKKISKIGNEKVLYNGDKMISIGDKKCEYDTNNKLIKIGNDVVTWETYDPNPPKTQTEYVASIDNHQSKTNHATDERVYYTDGKISRIGDEYVHYFNNQISRIGDKSVYYTDGKISRIGDEYVLYFNNQISRIGDKSVYYTDGKISRIGDEYVHYFNGKISRIGDKNVYYINEKIFRIGD